MKDRWQQNIFDAAPTLYKQSHWPMPKTCMCWGITCGDGWHDIILDLSIELEPYAKSHGLHAVQVKEKFGGLRFNCIGYPDFGSDAREVVLGLIRKACSESARTCETCGAPGREREFSWIKTLCDKHALMNINDRLRGSLRYACAMHADAVRAHVEGDEENYMVSVDRCNMYMTSVAKQREELEKNINDMENDN